MNRQTLTFILAVSIQSSAAVLFATVGEILVQVYDVFDPSDPREDNWVFRTANALHYKTRPVTVVDQLTFRRGPSSTGIPEPMAAAMGSSISSTLRAPAP